MNTKLAPGNIVAGGWIAQSGESASTVGSTPLQLLVDYAPMSSSSSSTTTAEQMKRAEYRALKMPRQEKGRLGRHHDNLIVGK